MRKQLPIIVALAVAGLCWLGARALDAAALEQRASWPDAEEHIWVPPPEAMPVLAMGYRQLWADILWTRTLVYYGSSRKTGTDYPYLTDLLDGILTLDPKFRRVYRWANYAMLYRNEGGNARPEEYLLSAKYLERGMKEFPEGYELFWLAGIRYYLDLTSDDPEEQRRYRERGAALIEQAMHKPDAPASVTTLAATLRSELGQHERALHDLRQVILTTDDEEAREKLITRYNQLASKTFPEEAMRAYEDFRRRWMEAMPYAPPNMYVLLGDPPAPAFDLEQLATPRDLFGVAPETDFDALFAPAAAQQDDAPLDDDTTPAEERTGDQAGATAE